MANCGVGDGSTVRNTVETAVLPHSNRQTTPLGAGAAKRSAHQDAGGQRGAGRAVALQSGTSTCGRPPLRAAAVDATARRPREKSGIMDTASISYRVADFLKRYPPFNAVADA